jgi:hypothetical protein
MKLSDYPMRDWIGARVIVKQGTHVKDGVFLYEGTVIEISGKNIGSRPPRVFVKPPSDASFVTPKWIDSEILEVTEFQ